MLAVRRKACLGKSQGTDALSASAIGFWSGGYRDHILCPNLRTYYGSNQGNSDKAMIFSANGAPEPENAFRAIVDRNSVTPLLFALFGEIIELITISQPLL